MAVKLLDKDEWTKDGRKWIFYDYVKNLDGSRRKYKSKKFFTKTEALKAEREFLTINADRSDKDRNMTFKDLYTLFYAYKEDKVKYTTLKTYRDREKFFKDLDNVKLKDFNIEHFEKWKKQINSYGYTTNHKNHLFKFFKELLNFATKWYNFNFTATYNKMTNFTDPNEIPKEMLFFTYEEFKKFISVEDDILFKTLFETLYYCGLRRGELRGLQWKDIDLEHRTLSVRKQITDRCGSIKKYKFVVPKTQNSIRTLKMPKVLTEDLKKAKLEAKQMSGFNENYFVAADAWPISSNALTDRKNSNCDKSGVKQIRLHDFRHSCASLLINEGANIQVVARYLGHTKIEETLKTYSHLFISTLDEIVDVIDSKTDDN